MKKAKKIPQISGLKRRDRFRKLDNIKVVKVIWEGVDKVYTYSVDKFCDIFYVKDFEAKRAAAAGYIFIIRNGVMYMRRKEGDEVYIGSVKNRQAKKE
jgi:hypothetical protein